MSAGSSIEWTEATWNPVVGCTPVSPGCLNCYAASMARRHRKNPAQVEYHDRVVETKATKAHGSESRATLSLPIVETRGGRAVFTGRVETVPTKLGVPLKWRRPRMIFVNSMSDLFHESVPFEFIDRVFAVMALCPRHAFQVLTKRPERMAEYLKDSTPGSSREAHVASSVCLDHGLTIVRSDGGKIFEYVGDKGATRWPGWPLKNVWLGASCEDQARADERIPHLLRCPAAVRFLSCEPLLSAIDLRMEHEVLTDIMDASGERPASRRGVYPIPGAPRDARTRRRHVLDWVIVGGESGAKSRPSDVAWHRSLREQCRVAGVPFFEKQLGARPESTTRDITDEYSTSEWKLKDRKGGDMREWPEDLRVREWPPLADARGSLEVAR